ncbi:hypothetical protein PsorP6_010018 [Peronosclerospora sorghi]|uniref:Uncharacterized protein n=1 Tax=Peronosclerospora sorghi TaxID=230839 RepID=A0ACC0VV79_9STRA|nr:hypothetical protein PsorP6_010018 [Peronosclerospora sorghi]
MTGLGKIVARDVTILVPFATDGYPAAIWDKITGAIHPEVVEYGETYYDVRAKLQREWQATGFGRKLVN